jgi:hypothetical protein
VRTHAQQQQVQQQVARRLKAFDIRIWILGRAAPRRQQTYVTVSIHNFDETNHNYYCSPSQQHSPAVESAT